jgi:3-deoxy-7-phosphoheptulonate synthase
MLIGGPCGVESRRQAFKIARFVKGMGATHFRAGCWKGQNYPVVNGKPEYKGLGLEGVKILTSIQRELKIPCVTDMQSVEHAEILRKYNIAYPQVGARNMDSLELLRQFRKIFATSEQTIILKRGPSSTVKEWIGAAEHLGGPEKVILCERGTVHFDRHDYTRFRLDFVGVAEVKEYHKDYRIIMDVSHGSGDRNLAISLSRAALSISDGLMVEVHYDPDSSPTDAPQTIDFDTFTTIAGGYESYFRQDTWAFRSTHYSISG